MGTDPATNEPVAHDFQAHARDYSGFTKLLKYSTIIAAIIGFIVVFVIIA